MTLNWVVQYRVRKDGETWTRFTAIECVETFGQTVSEFVMDLLWDENPRAEALFLDSIYFENSGSKLFY